MKVQENFCVAQLISKKQFTADFFCLRIYLFQERLNVCRVVLLMDTLFQKIEIQCASCFNCFPLVCFFLLGFQKQDYFRKKYFSLPNSPIKNNKTFLNNFQIWQFGSFNSFQINTVFSCFQRRKKQSFQETLH